VHLADYCDFVANELFEKHSLSALVVCISMGRELSFQYEDWPCSITWLNGELILYNGVTEERQVFEDMTTLVIHGKLGEGYFLEEWDKVKMEFLY